MGLYERIQRQQRRNLQGKPQRKSSPFMWPAWTSGQPQWHLVDFETYIEQGYNANSLAYSAIRYKAMQIQQASLRAYTGDRDNPEPLSEDEPLARLVTRPNEHQSWNEMQSLAVTFLNIAGDSYFFLDRPTAGGLPEAIYTMRPDRVYIVPEERGIEGYVYVPQGRQVRAGVPMLPENVMHVKLPNPGDPLEGMGYGLSPFTPTAHMVDVDNAITRFLNTFFQEGVQVPGVLSFEDTLTDEIIARIRDQWQERHGGMDNWARRIAVLEQGGSYERTGLNFEEMAFDSLDERNESRILGPFGVPPILIGTLVGLRNSPWSNISEARRIFWEDTMLPESGLFESEYQYYLQDENAWVALDYSGVPALQKDIPALVEAAVELIERGHVPPDVAYAQVGLDMPPLPQGDTVYVPMNLLPVGSTEGEPPQGGPAPDVEEDEGKVLSSGKKKANGVARPKSTSVRSATE